MANLTFTQSSVPAPSAPSIGKSTGVADFLMSFIRAEEKVATEAYSEKLREHATQVGWPEKYANQLGIAHDGDGHVIVYPKQHGKAILDLEYGTTESQPLPAMRTFMFGGK